MKIKKFKYSVDYNSLDIGYRFYTKREAQNKMNQLRRLNLWGYSIRKI